MKPGRPGFFSSGQWRLVIDRVNRFVGIIDGINRSLAIDRVNRFSGIIEFINDLYFLLG